MISYIHPDTRLTDKGILNLMRKFKEDYYKIFHQIDYSKVTVVTYRGSSFLINRSDTLSVKYTDKEDRIIPRFYKGQYVEFEGVKYHKDSPLIAKAVDTRRIVLRENAYQDLMSRYYENNDDLIQHVSSGMWIHKDDAVLTVDTNTYEHKGNTYQSGLNHYKYAVLSQSPSNWGEAPKINETLPVESFDGRRVGIELEFGDTFNIFSEFPRSPHAKRWFSVRDGSLDPIPEGIEFVSTPLKLNELDEVSKFIDFCKYKGATTTRHCGYHVHIGAEDINFMDVSALIALCTNVESEMFKLGGADRIEGSYCKPLNGRFKGLAKVDKPSDKKSAGRTLYSGLNSEFETRHRDSKYRDSGGYAGVRYHWVNIDRYFQYRNRKEQQTIEFRNHEATWDTKRFINYTLLCYYIVEYAKNHSRKTCETATLYDVIGASNIKHRRRLLKYLKQTLAKK